MKSKIGTIFFMVAVLIPIIGVSQTRVLKGKVRTFNRYPVKNTIVLAKKSKSRTTTDENGLFAIEVKNKDLIQIKHPGFLKIEEKVTEGTDIIMINLILDATEKNIEQVVEDGVISQADLDYALENLAKENNAYSRFPNVYDAIKFAIPEAAMVESNNGKKGFVLRGTNSLTGSNNALYLVNGSITSDISNFAPSEIRRIYKLSNSQAAMYGSQAANGVICVETY